ncbi:hypothetical protein [Acinetobacter sp. Marseille-Q1618]|uniref:hypothetical protein n=1 Tax=Acinetobacter sp. Marseille-Q1618 TaxID=2697502 RepID=UPI00156DF0F9|nr:hypothetical protein [Acinetobacter sp. Marseille-Q1618]
MLSKNKYGNGSIGYNIKSKKTETTFGFSLREIQSCLAGYKTLKADEKYNMFPYITSQNLACIWIDQDVHKEDYYFNFQCSETTVLKVDQTINDYDVVISLNGFLELMIGTIQFKSFEEEFILKNDLKSNLFKDQYDSGFLIKNARLIKYNEIGFNFDTLKSPLISDFI